MFLRSFEPSESPVALSVHTVLPRYVEEAIRSNFAATRDAGTFEYGTGDYGVGEVGWSGSSVNEDGIGEIGSPIAGCLAEDVLVGASVQ